MRIHIESQNHTPLVGILVHVSVGGDRYGTVIMDPDGARIECK